MDGETAACLAEGKGQLHRCSIFDQTLLPSIQRRSTSCDMNFLYAKNVAANYTVGAAWQLLMSSLKTCMDVSQPVHLKWV